MSIVTQAKQANLLMNHDNIRQEISINLRHQFFLLLLLVLLPLLLLLLLPLLLLTLLFIYIYIYSVSFVVSQINPDSPENLLFPGFEARGVENRCGKSVICMCISLNNNQIMFKNIEVICIWDVIIILLFKYL